MVKLFLTDDGPTENNLIISSSLLDNKFNFPMGEFGDNRADLVRFSKWFDNLMALS